MGRRFKVLHLFSGPSGRRDGLAAYLKAIGIDTVECDIINKHLSNQDILDDAIWGRIRDDLVDGVYDFVFAGPPCRTFSESRSAGPGPPVLRDQQYPYGFPKSQHRPGLLPQHYVQIREDNLLAERTAEACAIMQRAGRPFAVEQPTPFKGAVTMFQFESFEDLVRNGASFVYFDQCMHGAPTKKPTTVLAGNCDCSSLEAKCNHPYVTQTNEDGSTYQAPHPSYVGKRRPDGTYCTSDLAAYPKQLNCALATVINSSLVSSQASSS